MKIRLYNALILTMDNDLTPFEGEIWVNDDRIEYIGKCLSDEEIAQKTVTFDETRDCNKNLIMPSCKELVRSWVSVTSDAVILTSSVPHFQRLKDVLRRLIRITDFQVML